jgi:hypothetical protein
MSEERFRLPKWLRRDGVNAPFLEMLWRALASSDPDLALAMLYLAKAAGKHLDAHGRLYGLPRLLGESDDLYRQRIVAELLNPRSKAEAIVGAIETALPGVTASVTTPYEEALAEGAHFFDGTWRFDGGVFFKEPSNPDATARAVFYVDVFGPDPDLTRARAVIERLRAAGYIPTIRFSFQFDTLLELPLEASVQRREVFYFDGTRTFDGSWFFGLNDVGPEEALD